MLSHDSIIKYWYFLNWYLNPSQQDILFLLLISIYSHRQVEQPPPLPASDQKNTCNDRNLGFLFSLYNILHLCAIFLRQYHGRLVTFFSFESFPMFTKVQLQEIEQRLRYVRPIFLLHSDIFLAIARKFCR